MRSELFCGALALLLAGPAILPQSAVAAAADKAQNDEPFGRFTIEQLEAKLKDAKAGKLKLFVYDNNSRERFRQSHVPTARWVDYTKLQATDLPKEKDATLVFYCANEH